MHVTEKHPSDEELLLALDGELPPEGRSRVEVHLARCDACRARCSQLEKAAAEFSDAYRGAVEGSVSPRDEVRHALESRLLQASERWERAWWLPFATARPAARGWAFPAVAVAAVMLGGVLLSMGLGRRAKAPGIEAGALPVASLTPGATVNRSVDEICGGHLDRPDQIPASMRQQVLRAYGMEHVSEDDYELDYLITPELGGATNARNLWPQPYGTRRWNARVKDQLEDLLPRMVCAREIDLATAQHDIAVDWIAAYRKYFRTSEPITLIGELESW